MWIISVAKSQVAATESAWNFQFTHNGMLPEVHYVDYVIRGRTRNKLNWALMSSIILHGHLFTKALCGLSVFIILMSLMVKIVCERDD